MTVSLRQRIAFSYGLLVLLVAAIGFTIVAPPIERRFSLLAGIDESRDLYRRSQAAIAAQASAAEIGALDETLLLTAATDALAGAELQQTIKRIVEASGALLVSTAFRRNDDEAPLIEVPVAVRVRSSMESLADILQTIEDNRPRLFVQDLVVQSRHGHGRVLRDLKEELEVQFDVVGYLLPPESQP